MSGNWVKMIQVRYVASKAQGMVIAEFSEFELVSYHKLVTELTKNSVEFSVTYETVLESDGDCDD